MGYYAFFFSLIKVVWRPAIRVMASDTLARKSTHRPVFGTKIDSSKICVALQCTRQLELQGSQVIQKVKEVLENTFYLILIYFTPQEFT